MKQPYYQLNHHRLSQDAIFQTNGIHLDGWYALRKPLTARGNSILVSELTENSQSNTPSRNITLRKNLSMNDPQHISSFVPGAYQELLAMIVRGEREREKDCQALSDYRQSLASIKLDKHCIDEELDYLEFESDIAAYQKKGVDLQLQFPFDLYTRKQEGENEAHNLENENYYERTNCIN